MPQPQSGRIVVTTGKEASAAVVRLVEMSTEQAERLVEEATEDANRIREEANRTAHQLTTDARTRAERVESEARVNAERLQADALGRAEKLDREIEARRGEMFGDLERQRDDLTAAVASLRNFETAYRTNLTSHLRSQIETLESGRAEPGEIPDVVRELKPVEGHANGIVSGQGEHGGADQREEPRATAGVQAVTPRASTLSWETSADLVSPMINTRRARSAGPTALRPCIVLGCSHRWNFRELSARVVEETAFAAYCLCVTSTSAVLTKKWGSHDHR